MRLSPKAKRNLSRIVPFGIIWFLLGNIFLLIEIAAVGSAGAIPATAIQLNIPIYIFASIAIFMVGLLVGTFEVLYLNNRFTNAGLGRKVIYKTAIYMLILFVVILITFPIAASMELQTGLLDARVWSKYGAFLQSKTYLSTNVQLTVQLVTSLFYFEISENIGYRTMTRYLSGKYHQSTQEKRVFMFLDMKSSTAIAEKLGHDTYFEFLRTYYANLSDSIVQYEGEIYQYVGDEVVISWPIEKGISNWNCIRCFLAMQQALKNRSQFYLKKFNVQPTFKAGMHCGEVTTGEIGALKREIIFTGDTLNATARIQALCNAYGVNLLLSHDLKNALPPSTEFRLASLGTRELKGREKSVELLTLRQGEG